MRSDLINFIAARQDYVWFIALLAWVTAGALWWRFGRSEVAWGWLGWSVLGSVGVCLGEMIMLAMPVHPRPETAHLAPHRWGDAWLGLCAAVQLGGWWHALAQHRRQYIWVWLPALSLAVLRWQAPDVANGLLALGTSIAALVWRRRLPASLQMVVAPLVATWAGSWLSSHGFAADLLDQRRRWMEVSHAGTIAAAVQLVSAFLCTRALARVAVASWPVDVQAERVADLRQFVRRGALWLLVGFALSAFAGEMAQATFERSALTRIRAMAMALDVRVLEQCLGPDFRIDRTITRRQPSGIVTVFGASDFHSSGIAEPIRAALQRLRNENPDIRTMRIRTFRDGQTLLAFGINPTWSLTIEHPVSPQDKTDWERQTTDFRGMLYTSYDEVTQARAALVTPEGKMLGWLVMDMGVSSWLAAQTQSRASVFAVVALGLGVLVLWCVQRWREREAEAARVKAALAIAGDRLKTSFLAKVSHELRTPLQSILGYGELAQARITDPRARQCLGSLMQHGRLLTRLVNDLIDLSAVEVGALRLMPEPLRLPDALSLPAEALQPRATAKGLDYIIETAGPSGAWIEADPERLRQIVLNLTGNAIKFTARGRVVVRIRWEASGDQQTCVTLSVEDTGPGIAPEERERLFKPFSRLATTGRHEGAGLGLAITAGLCGQMNGSLVVESDARTGSCFHAKLLLKSITAPRPEGTAKTSALPGRRILIADDNALIRELFLEHLLQLGARCAAAVDGEQAWERIQRETYDVLVLDLSMPKLDGLDLARRIRARLGSAPRLIAASAHASPEYRAQALEAGFDEFLIKPVPLQQLSRAVQAREDANASLNQVRERLRQQFRAEIPTQAERLATLVRLRKWDGIQKFAHHLRNSAFAIDDEQLAASLAPLEHAAETARVDALDKAWQDVSSALTPWLTDPASTDFAAASHGRASSRIN